MKIKILLFWFGIALATVGISKTFPALNAVSRSPAGGEMDYIRWEPDPILSGDGEFHIEPPELAPLPTEEYIYIQEPKSPLLTDSVLVALITAIGTITNTIILTKRKQS